MFWSVKRTNLISPTILKDFSSANKCSFQATKVVNLIIYPLSCTSNLFFIASSTNCFDGIQLLHIFKKIIHYNLYTLFLQKWSRYSSYNFFISYCHCFKKSCIFILILGKDTRVASWYSVSECSMDFIFWLYIHWVCIDSIIDAINRKDKFIIDFVIKNIQVLFIYL